MSNVACIAVHPDDETLGCGGTLLKHAEAGDPITWIIVTEMKSDLGFSDAAIAQRDREIEAVGLLYGFSSIVRIGFPTTRLDSVSRNELVGAVTAAIGRAEPEILYLPFCGDAHSDHRVVFEASAACLKSFRYPTIRRALMMETLSETEYAFPPERGFAPNAFVDITSTIEKKIEAMRTFQSEFGIAPFPRSERIIRSLASFRGSFINREYAEAFALIKDVWL